MVAFVTCPVCAREDVATRLHLDPVDPCTEDVVEPWLDSP
jgi:hypothetical protein